MISRRLFLSSAAALPFFNLAARAEVVIAGKGDQTPTIQAAIFNAAKSGGAVQLGPGTFEVSTLTINRNVTIQGVPGATKLFASAGGSIFSIRQSKHVVLQGIGLSTKGIGGDILTAEGVEHLVVQDCDFSGGAAAMRVSQCGGRVSGNRFQFHEQIAMQSIDSKGFVINGNTIQDVGNCGIQVWQTETREDGSVISDNLIRRVASKDGGNGQNGNGINVFKASNVIVSNNRISDCAFTGIRNNSGPNCIIQGNSISRCNEVALFVEFNHDGSVVADNLIETAASGIKLANLDVGGRMAQCTGNVIRNMSGKDAEGLPLGGGILCDADVVVSNNVIDKAENFGIRLGWGPYGQNLVANNNLIMTCERGIDFSTLAPGPYIISNNMIKGAKAGAIMGMDYDKPVTADLALAGAKAPENVTIMGTVAKN
jgi:uncharacterized secreted repeat protein (TIGR03808 family)